MADPFYTTKLFVEIDVDTQFGPVAAMSVVQNQLRVPAVRAARIVSATTNYRLHQGPAEHMAPFPVPEVMTEIIKRRAPDDDSMSG